MKNKLPFILMLQLLIFTGCNDDVSLGETTKEFKKRASSISTNTNVTLSILSYNIFHLPSIASIYHYKEKYRAEAQKNFFNTREISENMDIIVVQEAFNRYVPIISNGLTSFINQSGLVGLYCGSWTMNRSDNYFDKMSSLSNCSNSPFVTNGGVKIYSKWPIEYDEQLIFKNSLRGTADYLSNKGASYVRINKNGKKFHIIGTHLQADEAKKDGSGIRKLQLDELQYWIAQKIKSGKIPSNEPIIFAGDFNIPHYDIEKIKEMTTILQSNEVKLQGDLHSYDESQNTILQSNGNKYPPQTLDYILVSKQGKQPLFIPTFSHTTFRAKNTNATEDLSDHHPIKQTFYFSY
ncbi:sphingomyelin phosphodiesterase [Tenacibaculum maritimum]|uniref:sphingomyelin phosphodiesterase n=1 Tax=Tenacibaculum maritimum TaxID=107401 RepID=UPI0012E4956E|nr:sphingomyelin phosphodiesterase [Tenacibaculum maritimum]CAA0141723.1 sphingomyelinase precursor [Tenacibaculum maritimum]CAA0141754.1 sphingomyelinase precursor [Tenacibaculum maritimum]CAA0141755.1 sphingomyelinase precursor [Tenacibaculum maritimum]CAA0188203.1 sphingomyelinase precursor [Tenacibaculum maritimum]